MTKTAEELLQQALDPADQAELVQRLQENHQYEPISDDPEHAAAWEAEIARRLEAIDRGESKPIPWEQVRDRLRQRLVVGVIHNSRRPGTWANPHR